MPPVSPADRNRTRGPPGGDDVEPGSSFERAHRRKLRRAEAHVAWMRTLVAAFVWLTVPFLVQRFSTGAFLSVIGLATGHTVLSHAAYARDWGSLRWRAALTSLGDAGFVLAIVAVSGGWTSPLTPLLYVSMAAIAYRFTLQYSLTFATAYAVGYVAVLTAVGDVTRAPVDLVLRVGLLIATGLLAALSSTGYLEAELERTRAEKTFEDVLATVPGDVALVRQDHVAEDAPGRHLAEVLPDWMDADAVDRSREALSRVFATGSTVEYEVTTEREGDEVATYRCVTAPLDDADGTATAVVVATDVTDRKLAERRLRDHAKALEQSNEALARYASLTAHDLREPLRDVVRYLQRIDRREDGLSADSREELDFVVERARRLDSLVRALHGFAEVDERPFRTETVDLDDALDAAIELADLTGPPRAEIERGRLPTVTADERAIVEILAHLVENAHHHGRRDPVRVRVDAEDTGDGWRVSVTDDGQGIHPRYHEQIFEPFRRLHGDARSPEAGMGLATTRRLVERLGGDIEVEARPGEGARFSFTVPERPVLMDVDPWPGEELRA